jgi:hypothetical protein
LTVCNIVSIEDSQASCGILYAGNATNHKLACNVIYQISNSGF